MARKRASAASARSTASSPSWPVDATERPRPHSTFSLKSGVGAAHRALVDDEAHGVRADIDDADRLELANAALLAEQPFQARQVQPLIRL